MSTILDGEVTRPESFDPTKNYALVVARGGNWLGDYDINDLQRILRHDQAVLSKLLFAEGAIQFETGGAIAPPVVGSALGGDALLSRGTYVGIESQNYIVTVVTGGIGGTATFTWRSTGSDNPAFAGKTVTIPAIALNAAAVTSEPNKYECPLGALGAKIAFVNANGIVNGSSSWVVQVTYGARPPLVVKASPDASHDTIRCYDIVSVIEGRPHRAAETAFVVPATDEGTTTIYGQWTRSIVTHQTDPELKNAASGRAQAWRERWMLTYQIEDTSDLPLAAQVIERRVFPLYTWNRATDEVRKVQQRPFAIDIGQTQGSLNADRLLNVDQNELLKGILATRTFDAHGSFVAAPLADEEPRAVLSTNTASAGKVRLTLAPSVVYVRGIPIVHNAPTDIEVDQATEFASVTGEQTTYTGTKFALKKAIGERFFPIRAISSLQAHVQIGTGSGGSGTGYETRSHSAGVDDALVNANIVSLLVVSANANGSSPYTAGTGVNQYTLVGDKIHWGSGTGSIATYYVSYRFNRSMVQDVDYVLQPDGYIDFSPGGSDPVTGGIVTTSYSYFLPRIDAIVVRPSGDYQVVRGIPAEVPVLPTIPSLNLRYVRVELAAGATGTVTPRRFDNDAIGMEALNRLRNAVEELTRNFAIADLFNQARAKTTGNFIDILCDDFAATDLADQVFSDGVAVAYDALIDVDAGELTVPFTPSLYTPDRATTNLPAGETAVRIGGAFYTIPFTDEIAITQQEYSQSYPVNPYADFTEEPVETRVTPDQDFFEAIGGARTATEIVQIRKTRALAEGLLSRQDADRLIRDFRARNGRSPRRGELLGSLAPEVVSRTAESIPARYMRQITLTLTGIRYVPGEKIRAKFDGKDVTLTHVVATPGAQGTGGDAAAIVASADTIVGGDVTLRGGEWAATFLIPADVPVGTREIVLYGNMANASATWNSANPAAGNYVIRDVLPFTSNGTIRTTVTEERERQIILEPIAQSVIFPQLAMISKVDIPLAAKPANGAPPLVFQIRATDRSGLASTPTEVILESLAKQASQVNVGASSSNVFTPADPVLCQPNEYRALVLRSESNAYEAYVAILGSAAQAGGGTVNEQQIPGGIFMDSANNTDWTLHQGWDLRMRLWVARFAGTVAGLTTAPVAAARTYFDQIALANMTGFTLNVDQVQPDGTAIDWEYSTDGLARNAVGKAWKPFVPFVPIELDAVATTLDLRATLRTDSVYVSPAIHRRNLSVLVTVNKTAFVYVSKRKTLTEDATHIKGEIEIIEAPGTGNTVTKVFVSVDGDAAVPTWRGTANGTPCTIDSGLTFGGTYPDGFSRYTFDISGFTTSEKKQLRLRIEGGTPDRAKRPRIRQVTSYQTPS